MKGAFKSTKSFSIFTVWSELFRIPVDDKSVEEIKLFAFALCCCSTDSRVCEG